MTPKQRTIIILVATAFFIEGLDSSIMNTSLPQISMSLGTTPLHLKIALTTYLLVAGIFIPISGWLADKFGTQVIFRLAIMIFLSGSILCGFSENLSVMVIGRIIQGVGGALSVPIGRLLLVRHFTRSEFISSMSSVATFSLIGPSIGPLIGGFLTTYINWRFIFFVNIPMGLFALYYVHKHISNDIDTNAKPFDFLGFILLATSLTILLLAFDTMTEQSLAWLNVILIMLLGAMGLVWYWFYAKKKHHPVISPNIFKQPVFRQVVLSSMGIRLGLGMVPFMGPLLLQLGLGMSAMMSGVYTAITGISMIICKPIASKILTHYPGGWVSTITCFLLCITFNLNILLCFHHSPPLIIMVFVSTGMLTSIGLSAINSISYSKISKEYQSMGTSFLSSFQQILQSFGIAIAAFILFLFLHGHTQNPHYSLHAFAPTYALLSLLPLISAIGFFQIRNQRIEQ